eukprot:11651504-Heterocapsa_arctica.AAC.1
MKELGWVDNTPTNITDHNDITREINDWPSSVRDGVEKGMDEFTTRKLYNKQAQKQPLNAGALRTIITDGV